MEHDDIQTTSGGSFTCVMTSCVHICSCCGSRLCAVKTTEGLQQAALEEYGADLHVALRSRRDELLYLRQLTEMLFPFVMPPKATDCKSV